jgi:hypothetical protein
VDILDKTLDEVRSAAKLIPYARRKATPKKPVDTLTLGNLGDIAWLAATTNLRGATEPAVDPDQQLEEELVSALAGMLEASGDMEVDPSGSSLLDASPPRDATTAGLAST